MHTLSVGAKVVFPTGADVSTFVNRVVECSWSAEQNAWVYMRERRDKDTTNAWHVYEKVVASIQDDWNDEALLGHVDHVLKGRVYDEDEGRGAA